jgi:hypothetical protein
MMLERNQISFPPVKFGVAVGAAYQTIATEREKAELAASKAV